MNDSNELVSIGKLGVGTPSGSGLIRGEGFAEEPPASPGQATVPVADRTVTLIDTRRIPGEARPGAGGYAALEADFRSHHETNAARRRGPYEHYRLVYRYGYDLGADRRYRTAEWADVEQVARPRWEERNPGSWAQFQETIRYAWEKARRLD